MTYGFSGNMRNYLGVLNILGVLGGEKPVKGPERSDP